MGSSPILSSISFNKDNHRGAAVAGYFAYTTSMVKARTIAALYLANVATEKLVKSQETTQRKLDSIIHATDAD